MRMLCDINPEHGEMKVEPMYGTDGKTIMQYGLFCQYPNCDGYGGPVKEKKVKDVKPETTNKQMELFNERT